MTESNTQYFQKLVKSLGENSSQSVVSRLAIRSPPLREHLWNLFSEAAGKEGSFLSDPVFEPTFGWRESKRTMEDLSKNLLHPKLVESMDSPPKELKEQRFAKEWSPYSHQEEAWKVLKEPKPKSVVVTSGTGSGKTECFLVPILDDLVRESLNEKDPLVGVRALFLYPLNALINSQRDRLRAWTAALNGNVRFCLYNGETPEQAKAERKNATPEEIIDRETLRKTPPPVLVTNATMLEYMLVRQNDAPIVQESQGHLRWIVLDEAHTYVGSQAAELSLLLRRVMLAFGVKSENVRFIATSATIGDGGRESKNDLKKFLAQVAGVDQRQVVLVEGNRKVPGLKPLSGYTKLEKLLKAEVDESKLYKTLESVREIRHLRQEFEREKSLKLSDIHNLLWKRPPENKDDQEKALKVMDLCSMAKLDDQTFLPVRTHLFHRTHDGIWACSNSDCKGRHNTPLDSELWGFGKIYLTKREQCEACDFPVFELMGCNQCGLPVLHAQKHLDGVKRVLKHPDKRDDTDEFSLDAEDIEDPNNEMPEEAEPGDLCYITTLPNFSGPGYRIEPENQELRNVEDGRLILIEAAGHDLSCPHCESKQKIDKKPFRSTRTGAPFILSNLIPTLLSFAPQGEKEAKKGPYNGRRLITFTDSRQGTARFAVKVQQEVERSFLRSWLYHQILAKSSSVSRSAEFLELEEDIKEYEDMYESRPSPERLNKLNKKREKRERLLKECLLSWNDAKSKLSESADIRTWMRRQWNRYDSQFQDSATIADLLLYREFTRRPKWANNAETLGLVRLRFPEIDQLGELSIDLEKLMSLDDWKSFLYTAIHFFVRDYVFVNLKREYKNWMGTRAPVRSLIRSDQKEDETDWKKCWPQVNKQGNQGKLVKLLQLGLQKEANLTVDRDSIDLILQKAWDQLLESQLFDAVDEGYRLNLAKAHFSLIEEGWVCPITHRILDCTFKGLTPYLSRKMEKKEDYLCKPVKIPKFPYPFGKDVHGKKVKPEVIEQWIDDQYNIKKGIREGSWSDLSQRAISYSEYFQLAEHSAQLSGDRLRDLETEFKEGKLNVLSCSTTMEMGVDIGGISMVAMNNAPPSPANYLQRAGRAGRRKESRAVSFTLCKNSPHGEAVFRNPQWPWSPLGITKVKLDSKPIVYRHIHSFLLSCFLQSRSEDSHKLDCAWFFAEPEEESGNSQCSKFIAQLEDFHNQKNQSEIKEGLDRLVNGTLLMEAELGELLEETIMSIKKTREIWQKSFEALMDKKKELLEDKGATIALKSIELQLKRVREEYLLKELATKGFLPSYGFPTDLVTFNNLMLKHFIERKDRKEKKKNGEKENDSPSSIYHGFPNRPLSVGLRDYAPGADVVIDGLVYRSAGVTLNWKKPILEQDIHEVQDFQLAWKCDFCGSCGSSKVFPNECHVCSHPIKGKSRVPYLRPAGFSVSIVDETHNDISSPNYLEPKDPWIAVNNQNWRSLPNPALGRYRTSDEGKLIYLNKGQHDHGYAICLKCGRAEDEKFPPNKAPRDHEPLKDHTPLRTWSKEKPLCEGNGAEWSIKRHQSLGHESMSHVFELQLRHPAQSFLNDPETAYSIAVAIRESLAGELGINTDELGISVVPRLSETGEKCQSILIYDRASGGAGFATAIPDHLKTVMEKTGAFLGKCTCDRSCHKCLLTYDTQFKMDLLDRTKASQFLDKDWFKGFSLPKAYQYFGNSTQYEFGLLNTVMVENFSRFGAKSLQLFIHTSPEFWDFENWKLFSYLRHRKSDGRKVQIILPQIIKDRLRADNALPLLSLVGTGIEICFASNLSAMAKDGALIASVESENSHTYWAVNRKEATTPDEYWGTGLTEEDEQIEASLVCVKTTEKLPEKLKLTPFDVNELVNRQSDDFTYLRIHKNLNGPLNLFGKKFWELIVQENKAVDAFLRQSEGDLTVCYSDRYIKSPVSVLLLSNLLNNLVKRTKRKITVLSIQTLQCSPNHNYKRSERLCHDWERSETRDSILLWFLAAAYKNVKIDPKIKRELPHFRSLSVVDAQGNGFEILLDQGVGFWQLDSGGRYFDFFKSEEDQYDWMKGLKKPNVKNSNDFGCPVMINILK